MTFPDGSIKDGQFENNIFIAPAQSNEADEVSIVFEEKVKESPVNSTSDSKSVGIRTSKINIRAMSRGKNGSIVKQITSGSAISFQSNLQRAPDKLKPVQPPMKKDLNTSNEYDYGYGGYSSPG